MELRSNSIKSDDSSGESKETPLSSHSDSMKVSKQDWSPLKRISSSMSSESLMQSMIGDLSTQFSSMTVKSRTDRKVMAKSLDDNKLGFPGFVKSSDKTASVDVEKFESRRFDIISESDDSISEESSSRFVKTVAKTTIETVVEEISTAPA